jgi:hypothetical protein
VKVFLAVCALAVLPAAAFADCAQTDLQGGWQAYATTEQNGTVGFVRCQMTIDAGGTIAKTHCDQDGETPGLREAFLHLSSGPNCVFIGQFKLKSTIYKVSNATLAPSGNVVAGMGSFPKGGAFILNMIRYAR